MCDDAVFEIKPLSVAPAAELSRGLRPAPKWGRRFRPRPFGPLTRRRVVEIAAEAGVTREATVRLTRRQGMELRCAVPLVLAAAVL